MSIPPTQLWHAKTQQISSNIYNASIQIWFTENAIFILPEAKSISSLHFIILHTEHILSLTERKITENLKRFFISISKRTNNIHNYFSNTQLHQIKGLSSNQFRGSIQFSLLSSTLFYKQRALCMKENMCTLCIPSNILPNWK